MTTLVWFRNDLRLADNPALFDACESETGDVIAVLDAGFYAEGEASLINSVPLPGSVLVSGSDAELIKRAQTWQDVFATQIIPDRLRHTGLGDNLWRG